MSTHKNRQRKKKLARRSKNRQYFKRYYSGCIYNVKMFPYALTAEEIKEEFKIEKRTYFIRGSGNKLTPVLYIG